MHSNINTTIWYKRQRFLFLFVSDYCVVLIVGVVLLTVMWYFILTVGVVLLTVMWDCVRTVLRTHLFLCSCIKQYICSCCWIYPWHISTREVFICLLSGGQFTAPGVLVLGLL